MFQVVKRDGEVDEFKIGKITAAIHKAFDAKEKNYSEEMIDLLGLRVTSDFQKKIYIHLRDIDKNQSYDSPLLVLLIIPHYLSQVMYPIPLLYDLEILHKENRPSYSFYSLVDIG